MLNHQKVEVGGAKGRMVSSVSKSVDFLQHFSTEAVDAFKMSRTCPVAPTEPLLT